MIFYQRNRHILSPVTFCNVYNSVYFYKRFCLNLFIKCTESSPSFGATRQEWIIYFGYQAISIEFEMHWTYSIIFLTQWFAKIYYLQSFYLCFLFWGIKKVKKIRMIIINFHWPVWNLLTRYLRSLRNILTLNKTIRWIAPKKQMHSNSLNVSGQYFKEVPKFNNLLKLTSFKTSSTRQHLYYWKFLHYLIILSLS